MSDTHPNTYAMDANAKAKIEQHYEIIRLNNRIAALEAQNKKLVEALDMACWVIENGGFDENSIGMAYAKEYRAMLSEVTQ